MALEVTVSEPPSLHAEKPTKRAAIVNVVNEKRMLYDFDV